MPVQEMKYLYQAKITSAFCTYHNSLKTLILPPVQIENGKLFIFQKKNHFVFFCIQLQSEE